MADELPTTHVDDAQAWYEWLREHHATAPGTWLRIAKKGAPITSVGAREAVKPALCWGWIDGQARPLDEHFYLVRYTPRRARSKWSRINVEFVEELTAAGLMQPAGIAQVEAAQADGRWDAAYSPPSRGVIPPELQAAFDEHPEAAEAFAALTSANRFAFTYRIETAKRAETKARHVAKTLEMLDRGETYH